MNKNMAEFLAEKSREKFATERGTDIHRQLQFLLLDDDNKIAKKIKSNSDLSKFWGQGSRAEVPIAGTINGKFYSKRIDRLVFGANKEILFLDYKTDTNRARLGEYEKTMKIYASLLHFAFPKYKIIGFILWLNNWNLEKIIES
jgi:ATP-dependent exoDNAse (exonuclease V) beta subunit